MKGSVRIVGVPVDIRTGYIPNKSLELGDSPLCLYSTYDTPSEKNRQEFRTCSLFVVRIAREINDAN
jgi:hypothetical protein